MSCPFCSCPTGTVDVDKLRASLNKYGSWLPMADIPKDKHGDPKPGEFLLLLKSGRRVVAHWMPGGFCIEDHPAIERGWYSWTGSMFTTADKPTHWMPLPEAPPA